MTLKAKTLFITGASRGIGLAIAKLSLSTEAAARSIHAGCPGCSRTYS